MKTLINGIYNLALALLIFSAIALGAYSFQAFADGAAQVASSAPSLDQAFFDQVLSSVKAFGGMPWMLKVATVMVLVLSSMKVSFLAPLWAKLGALQSWAGMLLGLVSGILMLGVNGGFSWAGVAAYMFAGAGAVILHELLDSLKALPGLGPIWVSLIDLFEKIPGLGSGGQPAAKP